jgi:hypothetical protein
MTDDNDSNGAATVATPLAFLAAMTAVVLAVDHLRILMVTIATMLLIATMFSTPTTSPTTRKRVMSLVLMQNFARCLDRSDRCTRVKEFTPAYSRATATRMKATTNHQVPRMKAKTSHLGPRMKTRPCLKMPKTHH